MNTADDAPFDFAEEHPPIAAGTPWRVLVVDDDEEVFLVTEMTLRRSRVDGAPLELVYASDSAKARHALQASGPFSVALVDVVMDTPTAGLDLCRWIREQLRDPDIRLLVRTGQPGGASDETKLSEEYDIHDFLAKTETTGRALTTRVAGAVRAWRDLARARAESAALRLALELTPPPLEPLVQAAPRLLLPPRGHVQEGGHDGTALWGGWRLHTPDERPLQARERARLEALTALLEEEAARTRG